MTMMTLVADLKLALMIPSSGLRIRIFPTNMLTALKNCPLLRLYHLIFSRPLKFPLNNYLLKLPLTRRQFRLLLRLPLSCLRLPLTHLPLLLMFHRPLKILLSCHLLLMLLLLKRKFCSNPLRLRLTLSLFPQLLMFHLLFLHLPSLIMFWIPGAWSLLTIDHHHHQLAHFGLPVVILLLFLRL